VPAVDPLRRYYAPVSHTTPKGAQELAEHAWLHQSRPRAKVPLTVQYFLDHVVKSPKPLVAAPSPFANQVGLSLADQYRLQQGMKLDAAAVKARQAVNSVGLTLEDHYAIHALRTTSNIAR
jgi:hypothetical protein